MPRIKSQRSLVERLARQTWPKPNTQEEQQFLTWIKASSEASAEDREAGAEVLKFDDTNRPDLWFAEGLARQWRSLLGMSPKQYPFLQTTPDEAPLRVKVVNPGLSEVRPYIAAFLARGYRVADDEDLRGLIHVQDKLDYTFGRQRAKTSIGLYPAAAIQFPIEYVLVDPDEQTMVPLHSENDVAVPLTTILGEESTGREYGYLLTDKDGRRLSRVPFLRDARGEPISFPPILNSKTHGQIVVGDDFLMMETTGTDLTTVQLVATL
ncbi:MAG: hypothetical protein HYU86_08015 [Chloroflexi bacterium]|nr:hypothetical protein [Chloroflexota bacterium]